MRRSPTPAAPSGTRSCERPDVHEERHPERAQTTAAIARAATRRRPERVAPRARARRRRSASLGATHTRAALLASCRRRRCSPSAIAIATCDGTNASGSSRPRARIAACDVAARPPRVLGSSSTATMPRTRAGSLATSDGVSTSATTMTSSPSASARSRPRPSARRRERVEEPRPRVDDRGPSAARSVSATTASSRSLLPATRSRRRPGDLAHDRALRLEERALVRRERQR